MDRRSDKSPLSGSFSLGLDHKTKELVIWWRGKIVWSSGQWNDGIFAKLNSSSFDKDFVFEYQSDENETCVIYVPFNFIYWDALDSICGGVSGASDSCIDNNYFLQGCSMPSLPKCRDNDHSLYSSNWSSYGVMSSKGFKFDQSEKLSNFDCWMKCLNNCTCEAYSYTNEDETGWIVLH